MSIAINGPGGPKPTLIQLLHVQVLLDTGQPAQVQPTEVLPVLQVVAFVLDGHEGGTSQSGEFQDRNLAGAGFYFVDVCD